MSSLSRNRQAAIVVIVALAIWSWFGDAPEVVRWAWPVIAVGYVVVGVVLDRRDQREDGA